ncbi:hypothetical protein GCK72_007281 [Caenorhabditis remanei]|uniref:F-box associated domain-containing protein n=1 Tax=Caenorhabditis remanei TaxID=31234 RepID=A0A6A5HNG4_CAERE|nr:hypothetical protein GCK72_007281 [Caenorhabditis remanei]KAF1767322.1 hypothetical protein GCK72_007281 [Caenorhabditis remanei]
MTKPWTYLSLKAVFQYMDGNKRLELNFHCPALRSAECSVPLNLQCLTFEKEKIVANGVCYKVEWYQNHKGSKKWRQKKWGSKKWRRQKKVESKSLRIKTILDGRKHVRVEILKVHNSSVIPGSLKISTRNLDSGNLDLERVFPFINRSSFPLKELRVNIAKTPNLTNYLGFTQTLILFETNADLVRSVLYDPQIPNIVLENHFLTSNTTVALIQNWRDNQKEIGTFLTMQNKYCDMPFPYLDETLENLNGRIAYFNYSVLQNLNRRCISFPFNQTSELVLYSIRDGPSGKRRTKLEVMPIGSTGPGTFFDIFISFISLFFTANRHTSSAISAVNSMKFR